MRRGGRSPSSPAASTLVSSFVLFTVASPLGMVSFCATREKGLSALVRSFSVTMRGSY